MPGRPTECPILLLYRAIRRSAHIPVAQREVCGQFLSLFIVLERYGVGRLANLLHHLACDQTFSRQIGQSSNGRLAVLREALVTPHEELAALAKKEANSAKRTDRPAWNAVRIKRAERAAGVASDVRAQASEARREAVEAARAAEQFQ